MSLRTSSTRVALLVAAAVTIGLALLSGRLFLPIAAGLSWGCGVGGTLHIARRYPAYATGESWGDARWTALGTGVAALGTNAVAASAATFTLRLTLTVAAVVCGVGFAAYVTGTMAVLERTSEGTVADGSRSELSSPTDD